MTNTKKQSPKVPNDLAESLDFFVKHCQESGEYKNCLDCCMDNAKNCTHSEGAEKIRKLLIRQPEKPRVTRDEVKYLVFDIQNCGTPKPCNSCINSVVMLFKSKDIEIEK